MPDNLAEASKWAEARQMIVECHSGDEPIKFTAANECEMAVLLRGGVTVADFRSAIEAWERTNRAIGSDWGYIRAAALTRRGQLIQESREADL
jgi:hypothetical protein